MKHSPTPLRSALVVLGTAILGALIAVQSRINGEFGVQTGDSSVTALFNFASGLLILCCVVALAPRARRGLASIMRGIRRGDLPVWMLAGGPLGAFFSFNQAALTPIVGVAAFTVGVVCGLVVGGALVDRRGLGPAGRIPLTRQRIIGTVLVVLGATLASLPELRLGPASLLLLVPLLVGAGSALQSAMNGRMAVHGASVAAASFINFFTGAVVLAIATAVSVAAGGLPQQWPESPWLYTTGIIGVIVIAGIALMVRFGGVLLVGMANVAGQLIGSVAADAVAPFGGGPDPLLLVGAAVTLFAVILAALPAQWDRPGRRSPPHPPSA